MPSDMPTSDGPTSDGPTSDGPTSDTPLADVVATTGYGLDFCSVAARDNVIATQFHPEKSGPVGLQLYDNFVRRVVSSPTGGMRASR